MATVEAILQRQRCSSCGTTSAPMKVICTCGRASCGECALDDEIDHNRCWMCLDWKRSARARAGRRFGRGRVEHR